ncbi:MAG: glycosyltransferase family 2 protein [Clostridia bacterium]|nr:glycosyltransferase family 2 protein [Clostridia bacterium]
MKFSIITPTYNRGYIITRAINSVLKQKYGEWELIIVDDGSTDNTKEVINRYINNERIKYISYTNNNGVNYARNKGIAAASGDIITFLDSDDEFTDNALDVARKVAEEYSKNEVFMFPTITNLGDKAAYVNGDKLNISYIDYIKEEKINGEFLFFVRKKVFFDNLFPTEINGGEGILWQQIIKKYGAICINKPIRVYWQDTDSLLRPKVINRKKIENDSRCNELNLKYFENDFINYNPRKYARILSVLARNEIYLGNRKRALQLTLKSFKYNIFELRNYRNLLYMFLYKSH